MDDIVTMTAAQAERFCVEPLLRNLNTVEMVSRINACMKSKNRAAMEGALTALQVAGFGDRSQVNIRPTRQDAQRAALDLIKELSALGADAVWELREPLASLGYGLRRYGTATVYWDWAGQCGGYVRPLKLAA